MSVIWTIITLVFFVYQLHNENQHILINTLNKAKSATNQAEYVINWIYNQKVQEYQHKKANNLKLDFSLKDLIYKMNKDIGVALEIKSIKIDLQYLPNNKIINDVIHKMKLTKKEQYDLYFFNKDKYIFYAKPLLANKSCTRCHIHDVSKKGEILGSINAIIKLPAFIKYNSGSYIFLIFIYTTTWLTGLFIIWFARYKSKLYFDEKMKNYEESIYALVEMMEKRDNYTAGHSQRVAKYSVLVAKELGFSKDDIDLIFRAAMLHDIGKMDIPDALLLKPDTLSDDEYDLIKNHSRFGYEFLNHGPFQELSEIVLHHHERYDGKGYPDNLKANNIPRMSQIISIADAFDAMTTNRSYKEAFLKEEALRRIRENSGTQFNPNLIELAIKALENIKTPEKTTQMPKDKLDEMRFCYYLKDQLTGCYNLDYLKLIFLYKEKYENIDTCYVSLCDFSNYNKINGWKKGDEAIKKMAKILILNHPNALVIRIFGDSFILLYKEKYEELKKDIIVEEMKDFGIKFNNFHIDIIKENIMTLEELENKILTLKQ